VKELRFSPTRELIALLKRRGCRVVIFDPKFTQKEITELGYDTEPTLKKAIGRTDCAVLAVGHDEFKTLDAAEFMSLMNKHPAIVDCTHTLNPGEVEKAGAIYRGVGRGLWTK
jgi:UDP-N-acetyl-D-mannosaminuronate dehydrogenase